MKKILILILGVCLLVNTLCITNTFAKSGNRYPAVNSQNGAEKWGYINDAGAFVIQPEYDFVKDFNEQGIAIAAIGSSQYEICDTFFIDEAGKKVSGPFQAFLTDFQDGYAVLSGKHGGKIVDAGGKVILDSPNKLYEFKEGLVRFSQINKDKKEVFGYMNITGEIVIPAQYTYAAPFSNWLAAVEVSTGKYAMIDKTGTEINSLGFYDSYNTAEGMTAYMDSTLGKYGYKQLDGKVAIQPVYTQAEQFKDGFAVVRVETGEYEEKYGLVNKKGEYVIKPEYSGIQPLGQNLYAVSRNFFSFSSDRFALKAIFNSKGEKLTDYIYYSVGSFAGEYAAASDDTTTFFINTKGNHVESLPTLKGIGTITLLGDIIKCELDGKLSYVKKDGEKLWERDEAIGLGNNIRVLKNRSRPNFCTYTEYPSLEGMSNVQVQNTINAELEKRFIGDIPRESLQNSSQNKLASEGYVDDLYTNFTVKRNKNLLIVEEASYLYPIGAAHGMPSEEYYFIDLTSGSFYALKDLFKSGSKYLEKLTSLVRKQIQLDDRVNAILEGMPYFDEKPTITEKQGFIIGTGSLTIYFYPYEIAAYAAGFPEFEIPYEQLSDVLNTEGAFWKSFDKTAQKQNKIKSLSWYMDAALEKSIGDLVRSYESGIIEAINSNNFKKVEGTLTPGSILYNAQKKLVTSLSKQKIKEKLTHYEIYAWSYDGLEKTVKIFVLETIEVKYSGKNYVPKPYAWCYTAKMDTKAGKYLLSNIQKW